MCGGGGGGGMQELHTTQLQRIAMGGGKGLTMGMFAELHTYQSVSWGLPSLLGARLVQHVWQHPHHDACLPKNLPPSTTLFRCAAAKNKFGWDCLAVLAKHHKPEISFCPHCGEEERKKKLTEWLHFSAKFVFWAFMLTLSLTLRVSMLKEFLFCMYLLNCWNGICWQIKKKSLAFSYF